MSRVTGIGGAGLAASRPKPAACAATSGQFSIAGQSAAGAAAPSQPAQNVALAGMLALQEVEADTVQDKAAHRHGFALLDALSELQKGLLAGVGDDPAGIASLARLATEMPDAADPGLAAVLAAIALRAKLELLRRGVGLD